MLWPGSRSTGGSSSILRAADEAVDPAQFVIHVVKMSPHAALLGQPAVVAAADLADHPRVFRRREGYDAVGSRVGEVDVVAAREHRRLTARIAVARAAAIVRLDVVPEIDLELLHVRRRRSRAVVVRGLDVARHARVLLHVSAAAAAARGQHGRDEHGAGAHEPGAERCAAPRGSHGGRLD